MYFSDEIDLVQDIRWKDRKGQYQTDREYKTVYCDLTSVTGQEEASAGQYGHTATARAIVHLEDYGGQKTVRIGDGVLWLKAGLYDIYRTYVNGDVIELYLMEKEGRQE